MYGDLRNILGNNKAPKNIRKRVLVATPSLSYNVSSHYASSLCTSAILCFDNNIILDSYIVNGESILPMARNKCIKMAVDKGYDDIIFIDADQSWDPYALLNIIKSKKKVIGIPVPLKIEDDNKFNYHPSKIQKSDDIEQMVTVDKIGTGFLKINNIVLKKLYDTSDEIFLREIKLKNICEYSLKDKIFIGEDYVLCEKIKKLNFDIWITMKHISPHSGNKIFIGDLKKYHEKFL